MSVLMWLTLAATLLAGGSTWLYLGERDDLAASEAQHAEVVKSFKHDIEVANESARQQRKERAALDASMVSVARREQAARRQVDALARRLSDLSRHDTEVRDYVDASMPDALYRELCRPGGGDGGEDPSGDAVRSADRTSACAAAPGADERRPDSSVARHEGGARVVQR